MQPQNIFRLFFALSLVLQWQDSGRDSTSECNILTVAWPVILRQHRIVVFTDYCASYHTEDWVRLPWCFRTLSRRLIILLLKHSPIPFFLTYFQYVTIFHSEALFSSPYASLITFPNDRASVSPLTFWTVFLDLLSVPPLLRRHPLLYSFD